MSLALWPILALVLFAPWFLILSALYWCYPRQPRTQARQLFDAGALLLAYAGCVGSLFWSMGFANHSHGALWPQILATSVGYGVFLAVLTGAWFWRRRMMLQG